MAAERVVAAAMRIVYDLCMVGGGADGWIAGWVDSGLADGVDWRMGGLADGWKGWRGTRVVWVEDTHGYPKSTFRVSGMPHYCAPSR